MAQEVFTKVFTEGHENKSLLDATLENTKPKRISGIHCAKVVKVYDADTITVAFSAFGTDAIQSYKVRVCHIDSAEIKSKCPMERKLACMARDFSSDLLIGKLIVLEIDPKKNDKYGRLLGNIWYQNAEKTAFLNLSETLSKEKLANSEYEGQTKAGFGDLIAHHKLTKAECLGEEAKKKKVRRPKKVSS